jgi:hypothetical protein
MNAAAATLVSARLAEYTRKNNILKIMESVGRTDGLIPATAYGRGKIDVRNFTLNPFLVLISWKVCFIKEVLQSILYGLELKKIERKFEKVNITALLFDGLIIISGI